MVDQQRWSVPHKGLGAQVVTSIAILLPLPLGGTLDYAPGDSASGDAQPEPGTLVEVPLGARRVVGVIWPNRLGANGAVDTAKLKPIRTVLPLAPLPHDLMELISFVADYTLTDPGRVLRMAMSPSDVLDPPPARTILAKACTPPDFKHTPARRRVLDRFTPGLTVAELARRADVSDGVVRELVKAGVLTAVTRSTHDPYPAPKLQFGPALNAEQSAAAQALISAYDTGAFAPILLDGVTGSGKTEVYFEAIFAAVATGGQVLVLVPEIGLTAQWLARFEARFGVPPALWHSDVGAAEKRRVWQSVGAGSVSVVVGARSALFLPFQNLRLIIVDEEHDPSFRQEDGVLYHARDMAVVRARAAGCPVVLSSATPSLETQLNASGGRYQSLALRTRYGGATLPQIVPVDMRAENLPADRWLSAPLREALQATIAAGEQSLLFLNRRGYAPLTLCRTCGHRFACPDCTAWLVEHRFRKELHCHQCGRVEPMPQHCPTCETEDSLAACGPGVERLFEEVSRSFDDARITVMTSDTLASPKATRAAIAAIEAGEVDIVIGTQLITKGYHFEALTCVGIVDADLGLRGGDLRAGERTFQQLTQVSGRAGRAAKPGRVFLQTYDPQNPVLEAIISGDRDRYYALEAGDREAFSMPPYGRLAALILSGADEAAVMDQGRLLARVGPAGADIRVFGPAPAPFARLRGRFRARLLVHADKAVRIQDVLRAWLGRVRRIKGVRVQVDVDPYSFL